jgi:serine/threonine-protein kinase
MNNNPDGDTPLIGNRRLLAGRYLLMDQIGEGGAAVVYRARDQRLDRIVAIKLLRPQFTGDEASRKRFLNEARTAAGLNHPNVVDVYDFGENPDGSMFIAMQYIEGRNFKDILQRRGRMTAADLVAIIPQVCNALTAAHSRGLIHRDVKPQNIMIDSRGNVRLTDFGIVKALSGPELTQTGMTFGTAAYLSPEQATGDPVGPASDIYALGCVMYEMLSGSPPFTGDNPAVVAYKQVWEQPRPLHDWAPEVPPSLENIVMRCLNKDPARRYPTAAALAADIASLDSFFIQPTQAVALGAAATQPAGPMQPYDPTPNAEVSRPIQMPPAPPTPVAVAGSQLSGVPPVKVQTTNVAPVAPVAVAPAAGQATRRVDAPVTASTSRVQVVNPNSRVSNAWLPIALIVVALGLMICAFAASQGNLLSILGGNPTPTPPTTAATPTPPLPTPTLAPIVVATGTPEVPTPAPSDTPEPVPPTDTPPLPTLEPPPTITPEPLPGEATFTPEPLPTDTIEPPPPLPEDTPTFEPVDPTPAPSGGNSITIDNTSFTGGYTRDSGTYHGRTAQWVYGQGTSYSTMGTVFTLDDKPKDDGTLTIVGIDSEDAPKTPMRIVLNRDVVFEGPNPLPNDYANGPDAPGNWGSVDITLPAKSLQKGQNTLTITNLDPSNQINYPIFIMIDYVTISW